MYMTFSSIFLQIEKLICLSLSSHQFPYGSLLWPTAEVGHSLVPSWEEGRKLMNSWEDRSFTLVSMLFTMSEEEWEEKNDHKQKKELFKKWTLSETFKATLSQSLAGTQYWGWLETNHGLNLLLPNRCFYLPRLTNWTFVGLVTLPEKLSHCECALWCLVWDVP